MQRDKKICEKGGWKEGYFLKGNILAHRLHALVLLLKANFQLISNKNFFVLLANWIHTNFSMRLKSLKLQYLPFSPLLIAAFEITKDLGFWSDKVLSSYLKIKPPLSISLQTNNHSQPGQQRVQLREDHEAITGWRTFKSPPNFKFQIDVVLGTMPNRASSGWQPKKRLCSNDSRRTT